MGEGLGGERVSRGEDGIGGIRAFSSSAPQRRRASSPLGSAPRRGVRGEDSSRARVTSGRKWSNFFALSCASSPSNGREKSARSSAFIQHANRSAAAAGGAIAGRRRGVLGNRPTEPPRAATGSSRRAALGLMRAQTDNTPSMSNCARAGGKGSAEGRGRAREEARRKGIFARGARTGTRTWLHVTFVARRMGSQPEVLNRVEHRVRARVPLEALGRGAVPVVGQRGEGPVRAIDHDDVAAVFPVASYGTNAATLNEEARMSQRLTTRMRMKAKAAYAHAQASLPSSDKAPASSNIHDTSTAIAGDRRDEKCTVPGVASVKEHSRKEVKDKHVWSRGRRAHALRASRPRDARRPSSVPRAPRASALPLAPSRSARPPRGVFRRRRGRGRSRRGLLPGRSPVHVRARGGRHERPPPGADVVLPHVELGQRPRRRPRRRAARPRAPQPGSGDAQAVARGARSSTPVQPTVPWEEAKLVMGRSRGSSRAQGHGPGEGGDGSCLDVV